MKFKGIFLLCLLVINACALEKIRIGVLAFGTVNWELNIMQLNEIAKKHGFELDIKKLSSKNAISIALNANAVDIIVSDFIWVSRQRARGLDFTFYPYSKAMGGLYVRPDLHINNLKQLEDKKLGISGGPVNKTWLITRAYMKYKYKMNLMTLVEPTFAAPPILNKKVLDGSLDGAINFWHYNAKLKAKGMKKLIGIDTMLKDLGINHDIPFIGWVFSEKFAFKNKTLINSFLQASYETKELLNNSPKEWDKIRKLMRAKDDKIFEALKQGYIDGIPKDFGENEEMAAKKVFAILVKEGGAKLVGKSKMLEEGTFWKFKPEITW